MGMAGKTQKTLWYWPKGDLIRFNSEDDVKHFFSKMRINPEECHNYGIEIKTTEIEEGEFEYHVEENNAITAPIFNYNPYMEEDEQMACYRSMTLHATPENIIVDKEVYSSFPCIAYIWVEVGSDRMGEIEVNVFNVKPLSEISTLSSIQAVEDKFIDKWTENLNKAIDNEKRLEKAGIM